MLRLRPRYWSCSQLADTIRGVRSPRMATLEEWDRWRSNARAQRPVRYWLADTGLTTLQNVIMFPLDVWENVRDYLLKRFVYQYNTFRALPIDIGPADYADFGDRILPVVFGAFCRWVNAVGIEHFKWASTLTYDDEWLDRSDERWGRPTPQAEDAREVLVLYYWWQTERRQRVAADAAMLEFYADMWQRHPEQGMFSFRHQRSDEDEARWQELHAEETRLEQQYFEEDTAMLHRLIAIRSGLWT